MTPEEKGLLIKDLCGRLPYGVLVLVSSSHTTDPIRKKLSANLLFGLQKSVLTIKPYLRPMSSMTVEEMKTFPYPYYFDWIDIDRKTMCGNDECSPCLDFDEINDVMDWLNANHFDYRGLIPKGLALEALKGMYKNE